MVRTRSEAPTGLRERRAALLARTGSTGPELRRELTGLYDGWLADLLVTASAERPDAEVALVAVGSLGRREVAPYADVDLVLVHDGRCDVAPVAERLWYPIWDSGLALDHAVRTVPEARAVAERDARAALGLLDVRHVAGAEWLSNSLRATAHQVWRAQATAHLPALAESVRRRQDTVGELAHLLEPDLKESLGGLRDVVVLHALAAAQIVDEPGPAVAAARTLLLDVRGELHRGRVAAWTGSSSRSRTRCAGGRPPRRRRPAPGGVGRRAQHPVRLGVRLAHRVRRAEPAGAVALAPST